MAADGMVGADYEKLKEFATKLKAEANSITEIQTVLTKQVDNLPWVGKDYDFFKNKWHGALSKNLKEAADSLVQAAKSAQAQAQEQQQTSTGSSN